MNKKLVLYISYLVILILIVTNIVINTLDNRNAKYSNKLQNTISNDLAYRDLAFILSYNLGNKNLEYLVSTNDSLKLTGSENIVITNEVNKDLFTSKYSFKLGINPIAICTNNQRDLKDISSSTLIEILKGNKTNWSDNSQGNDKISLLMDDETKKKLEKIYDIKIPELPIDNNQALNLLTKDKNTIAFLPYSVVNDKFNLVNLDGKSIQDYLKKTDNYPLDFEIFLYVNRDIYDNNKDSFNYAIEKLKQTKSDKIIFN